MKAIEAWKAGLFVGTLALLGVVINTSHNRAVERRYLESPEAGPIAKAADHGSSLRIASILTPEKESKPTPPPPPKPLMWPSEVNPTQVIFIPDPNRPSSGVMDITLRPGDDLQITIEPHWAISYKIYPSVIEFASKTNDIYNFGDQFREEQKQSGPAGVPPRWLVKRTNRYRLAPGTKEAATMSIVVDRKEEEKPLPPVPPQRFGNLVVDFRRLQGVSGSEVMMDFDYTNVSSNSSIGVALSSPPAGMFDANFPKEIHLKGSMIDSGGAEFWCKELSGLRGMNANPKNLTEIGPRETRHVTMKYKTTWAGSPGVTSFRLGFGVIINQNYKTDAYPRDYVSTPNVLPSNCKLEELIFIIPVKQARKQ